MSWLAQIDQIEGKVLRLAQKLKRVQQEKEALQAENEQLKKLLKKKEDTIGVLTNRLETKQRILPVEKDLEEKDKEMLMQQIDQYIAELDKCIEWLHKI
jgi:predicted  nucleic acid-binding Zn-ribbon protein